MHFIISTRIDKDITNYFFLKTERKLLIIIEWKQPEEGSDFGMRNQELNSELIKFNIISNHTRDVN